MNSSIIEVVFQVIALAVLMRQLFAQQKIAVAVAVVKLLQLVLQAN